MGLIVGVCLTLTEIDKLFSTLAAPFCIPTSNVGVSVSLTPLSTLVIVTS